MSNPARLDTFLQSRLTSIKHVTTEVEWERKPDGTVRMWARQESTEMTNLIQGGGSDSGMHTVVLRLQHRDGATSVSDLLNADRMENQPLFVVPEASGYEELQSLGMLVVQVPWWDVAIKRLQEIPGVEMVHDAEVQWQIPSPVRGRNRDVSTERLKTVPFILDPDETLLKPIRKDLGSSVKVAVLDTGIDPDHPAFSHIDFDWEEHCRDFTGTGSWRDDEGHGTHVASILCGQDPRSINERHSGVAPGTQLYVGKTLDSHGSGSSLDIVKAMRWAAVDVKADIVSLSLGGGSCAGDCLLCSAVDVLTDEYGTLFTVSAGNSGPGKTTLTCPANSTRAIVVAAGSAANKVAGFSSRGPSENPQRSGPDIVAPGQDVSAAKLGARKTDSDTSWFEKKSGTSMAVPHVVGYLTAIVDYSRRLLKQEPQLLSADPQQFFAAGIKPVEQCSLAANCGFIHDNRCGFECQGRGRLDAAGFRDIVQQLGEPPRALQKTTAKSKMAFFKVAAVLFLLAVTAVYFVTFGPQIFDLGQQGMDKIAKNEQIGPSPAENTTPPEIDPNPVLPSLSPSPQMQSYPYFTLLSEAAEQHGLPLDLALALAAYGSEFNALHYDEAEERYGLMALPWPLPIPGHGVRQAEALFQPETSISVALAYFQQLLNSVSGNIPLAWQIYWTETDDPAVSVIVDQKAETELRSLRVQVRESAYAGQQYEIVQLFRNRDKAENYLLGLGADHSEGFYIQQADDGYYAVVKDSAEHRVIRRKQ